MLGESIRAFLRGAAQVLVLYPEHHGHEPQSDADAWRSDWEAIGGDWEVVGRDLQRAIDCVTVPTPEPSRR